MNEASEPRTERWPFITTIRVEPSGDAWKATEPAGEQDVHGRGGDPREAVKNYVEALE